MEGRKHGIPKNLSALGFSKETNEKLIINNKKTGLSSKEDNSSTDSRRLGYMI
jgi:hypothetical protein